MKPEYFDKELLTKYLLPCIKNCIKLLLGQLAYMMNAI